MYTITVSEKGGQQSTFEFNKPEITIGRMKGNDIVLPKGNVSKRHTRIFAQEGSFKIIDLDSTNGTYVNGRKITGEQPISDNDKIYIGDFILQVESEEAAGAGAPAPMPPAPPPGPSPGPTPAPGPAFPTPSNGGLPSPGFGAEPARPTPPPQEENNDTPDPVPTPPAKLPTPAPAPSPPGPGFGASLAPKPAPAPAPISAPRLPSSSPQRQDDATVDRPAPDRMGGGRPQHSQVSAIVASNELESEFDAEMHAAKHDVATVLFESITPQDLPFHYPPSPEDHDRFRQAVEAAVKTVNPNVDRAALTEQITQECVGLGPVDAYLDDPEVRDIYVNRFDFVLIRRSGAVVRAKYAFSHPQLLLAAAYRLLGPREMEVFTDEMRFNDGTRVHVVLPPISPAGAIISVRKPPVEHPSLEDLVGAGSLSSGMADFLSRATEAGRSIVIAGPTGSGKSTLLSALTQQMASGVRVVAIETGAHLKLPDNSVRLEPNPTAGFEARYLVHSALAMHPQRIVLDECRGAEAYDWVTAAACGTEGSMATLHGTSATEALGRMESLCLMGSANIAPRGLREQIARAVNIVVVVNRLHDGGFRVHQITEVQGVDLDAFRLNDIFYFRVEGADGGFHPTGYVPLFFEDMRHAGVDVDFGIFRE